MNLRRSVICASVICLLALSAAAAVANVLDGVGAQMGLVPVRAKLKFKNRSGLNVNDLHFYMYQHDRNDVNVQGATVNHVGPFNRANMVLRRDNRKRPPPPPGMHGCEVTLSGGNVPPGGIIDVDVILRMNAENVMLVDDIYWTVNGMPIQSPPALPPGGFRVDRASRRGNESEFHHLVCIENTSDEAVTLTDLKLYASMEEYEDPETQINWDQVPVVQNDSTPPQPPVVIPAQDSWCYRAPLSGPSYVGGHVYLKYSITESGRETTMMFGDHPVDSLCADPVCAGDDLPPTGSCSTMPDSCVGDLYQYDCEQNLHGYWRQGMECPDASDVGYEGGEVVLRPLHLGASYPNPFCSTTTIRFTLSGSMPITLEVFDVGGRRLVTLMHQWVEGGVHEIVWDGRTQEGRRLPPGDYLCRLRAGRSIQARTIVLAVGE
jgi:hypothetical protein